MFDFDNPKEDLFRLEDELLEDETEEEYDVRPRRRRRKTRRAEAASAAEREAVYVEKKKWERETGIGRLKFLALLEIIAILAVLWGWIQWLY